jgi:nucleoside-diphosphate-sugar epimerase
LAWSEDEKDFFTKAEEAQAASLDKNPDLTIFKTNLTFGPSTHLLHYLAQCSLVGSCSYANLVPQESHFLFAPIHTDDVAAAVGKALDSPATSGSFQLSGSEQLTLRGILDLIEGSVGGEAKASSMPTFDYLNDFLYGTASDLNMSRMIEYFENNQVHRRTINNHTWSEDASVKVSEFYKTTSFTEDDLAHPTLPAYKLEHLD